MNIDYIDYIRPDGFETLCSLFDKGEITHDEKVFFSKIMGIAKIPRDRSLNAQKQIDRIIQKFLSQYKVDLSAIKYIFYAHTGDFVFLQNQNTFKNIIEKNGIHNAFLMGTSLYKCASGFHAIEVSKILFESLDEKDIILVIHADTAFTDILKKIPGSTIMSDSTSLIVIKKKSENHFIVDMILEGDGRFSKGVFGSHQDQLQFQSVYVGWVSSVLKKIIEKNNLSFDSVKMIFPHNVNHFSWKQIADAVKIPIDRFYLKNVSQTAHGFGSDPFVNLKNALSEKIISRGDYYLLVTAGLGATVSAILMRY